MIFATKKNIKTRETGKYLKLDAAITEFAQAIGDDGSV